MTTPDHRLVVAITGASGGVGRATARRFAEDGCAVALIARGRESLEDTAEEVRARGGVPLVLPCDVAVAEDVFDAAERIEEELGPMDVWINNAMATVFSRIDDVTPEELRRVTDVTYHGQVYGTMAALRHMRRRERGTIVSVGSALAYRGIPLQAAYCAAKHATRGFLESLRCELIHDGSDIHVTEVHLPAMNTPQFQWSESHMEHRPQPVPPIFQPEVAARSIHWAAHHRRRQVYVGRSVYQTVWGNKIIPGILDHMLAKKAWSAQLLEEKASEDRPSNLYFPVESPGAHGPFDDRAEDRSRARELATVGAPRSARYAIAGAALALGAYGLHSLITSD